MNLIKKFYTQLFFLGLFFIPFNSYIGIPSLGEFSRESAFIFFVLGFIFFAVHSLLKGRFAIPILNLNYGLLIVFLIWCLICTLLNGPAVYTSYFKGTPGIFRFVRQYLVFIVSGFLLFIYYYNIFKAFPIKELFLKIRKVFFISFLLVCIYAILEISVVILNKSAFIPILELFNYFPFTEVRLDPSFGRISSVTWEPPYLAIYLITIFGWMFSYILTNKGFLKFTPALAVIVLTFFSGSRTALVVVFLQLVAFLFYILEIKKYQKYLVYFSTAILVGLIAAVAVTKGEVLLSLKEKIETLDFKNNLTKSISNKSRFGIQYANLKVFEDNPFIGVGFGQQGYYNSAYYPFWATEDNYEFELTYLNEEIRSFPPGFNLYIRFMAETGIIGLFLFLLFLGMIYLQLRNMLKVDKENRVFIIILMVSFVGFAVNWLQVDTLRIFGFWIFLALMVRVFNKNQYKLDE